MKNTHQLIAKIRRFSMFAGILILMAQAVSAQNITRIEYFYDTDPGFGNGTSVSFTQSANVSSLNFSASITSLSYSLHTLYIRSRDANNKWSHTNYQTFVRYKATTGQPAAGNIVKLEYFVDTDPGFGLGTNVPVTAALDVPNQNFNVNLVPLTYGLHTLYVRSKDANGKWSQTNYGTFVKFQAQTGQPAAANIVKIEYFVDVDPGFGAGTNVPVTPATDIPNTVFSLNLVPLTGGLHTLYVRTKDANGKWSLTNYGTFVKYTTQSGQPAAGNIVKMEYFVDADPGFGAGTNVPVTPAADIPNTVFSLNLVPLSGGLHTLYVRTKDSDGKWSLTNYGTFVKYTVQTGPASAGAVTRIEYFIDNDPGFGHGISIPFTHSTNVSALVANINLTTLPNGFHTFYIRSRDTTDKWSLTNYSTFTGGSDTLAPEAVINTNGSDTFCLGAGTYLYATYSFASSYQWLLNNVVISGATNISYIPTQTGNYSVIVSNSIGSDTSLVLHVLVNAVPTATISANGPLSFCQGGNVGLSVNATSGASYQWYANDNPIGGATNTSYSASASGVYKVKVTVLGGCSATSARDTVVVSGAPSATITPSGSTTFCTGDSITLSVPTGSGLTYHWSTNAATGSIKVFTGGTYLVTVTNSSSCSASSSATITVVGPPTATITPNGATTFCNGSNVLLQANTGTGLSYAWTGGSTASSIAVSTSGSYSVTVSNSGCSRVSLPVTVTVNPGPTVHIAATAGIICAGHPDTLTASGATTYAWSGANLNTSIGTTVIATPGSTTVYSVTGTTLGCIGTALDTVTVNGSITSVSTSTPTICSGASAILNASGAVTYTWSPTGTLNASTGASVTATPLSNTTYTVTGTSGTCTSTATVTINVNTTVTPSVTINATQTTICAGTSVTFNAAPVNGGAAPSYQWYKNGTLQIGSSGSFSITTLANNDSVWCVMTSNAVCPVPATATSNKVHLTVNPVLVPTISITPSSNPVCTGDPVGFTATITNGGANPTYQWKQNNANVGTNSANYTAIAPANNDSVWCILTSTASCASPVSVTSNKVKIVVNQVVAPTVSVTASQNPICAGANITFTASVTNGGSNPTFFWYKNGATGGPGTSTYIDNTLVSNDSVWCVFTSNATCVAPPTVTSNKIIIIVAPQVVPSVIVTTPATSICAGTIPTFTANPTNGGNSPNYQWYKDGILQAGNTNTYTSAVLNNDSVWCVITSNATCPVPSTATSAKVHMTVNPVVVPTIVVTASANQICAGDSVTFTAAITNGGSAPSYQWKRNGVNVGSNSAIYGSITLTNNDSVWCVLNSNAPCPSIGNLASNKIHLTVNAIVAPTISVSASQTTICANTTVTFTASITNGGTLPVYQWYKNGNTVGANLSTYSDNTLAGSDSVWCVLTSNANCRSTSTSTSNKIVITLTTTVVPSVTISASLTTVCAGTSVTFTAVPVNGGAPTYQWYKDGVLQAGNTGSYSSSTLANNDSVWCVMTSNANCVSPATATSNKIVMTINPIVVPTVVVTASQNPICAGDSVTFAAAITNGGSAPSYQWKKNGVNVGSNSAIYGTVALTNNDSVWCILNSNAPCPSQASVTSNKIHLLVNPIVAPTISVSASQTTICAGTSVTFTASITNGGALPVYQWYKNGNTVGTNLSTYTDNALAGGDSVWCVLTSNANCRSTSTASSNKIVITITTTVVPSVNAGASATTVCAGTQVTFTATPTNGGTPTYQWYKDGILQAGNTGTFSTLALLNNDSVWCVMTSNANCVSPATATSNKVVMTINPIVVPTVVVTASQNPICAGDSVTFTAAITNGGSAPSYQWKKNGVNVGSNSAIYGSITLTNNDSVWCLLNSNAPCPSQASVTSNKIHLLVNPTVVPAISVSATQTTICANTTVTFTASVTNGGTQPVYQWYKNGATVGTNLNTYTDNTLAGSDSVWCVLTSNANCRSTSTATSNKIVITLTTTVVPSVNISAPQTTICAGTLVTFTAIAVNGGLSPVYQWYQNGVLQVGGSATFSTTALANNDSVHCVLTSNANCVLPATVSSNQIVFTVLQPVYTNFSQRVCHGDSALFHGVYFTQSGIYRDTLAAANTCDSIIAFTLTVDQRVLTTLNRQVCFGGSYVFKGQTLSASGTYNDTLTSHLGCDSFVVLNLQVLQQLSSGFSASVCQGYTYPFNGQNLSAAGTYADTMQSVSGCDSIVTLTFSIRSNSVVNTSASICAGSSYPFGGNNLTQSGTFRDTVPSANGCDSVTVLALTVHAKPVPVINRLGRDTIRATTFVHYKWLLNDTAINGADTLQELIIVRDGSYSVLVTDSFGCSDTSAVLAIVGLAINETTPVHLMIYPNPTESILNIDADNVTIPAKLELHDALGRLIQERDIKGNTIHEQLDLSLLSSGVYLLTIRNNDKIWTTRRIVKN